jgi:hypothetical protein
MWMLQVRTLNMCSAHHAVAAINSQGAMPKGEAISVPCMVRQEKSAHGCGPHDGKKRNMKHCIAKHNTQGSPSIVMASVYAVHGPRDA